MRLQEIIEKIEERYPRAYACDWDNTGLQVGDREQKISRVYVALDATEETIQAGGAFGAQLLLTHHPLLFGSIKGVTMDTLSGRRVIALLSKGMSCYSMAQLAADRLGLEETRVLEEVLDGEGIGRVGRLPRAMSLEDCARLVKERFHLPNVKIFGEPGTQVSLAALSPGAGKSMTGAALSSGAEVLITGDIDHHTGIDMWDMGLPIIDAGHYGIEHIYIEDIRCFLEKKCPGVEVLGASVRQPFWVI